MMVSVTVQIKMSKSQGYELPEGTTVLDLQKTVGLYPDSTITIRDERVIPCDERLADGDSISFFSVASGG